MIGKKASARDWVAVMKKRYQKGVEKTDLKINLRYSAEMRRALGYYVQRGQPALQPACNRSVRGRMAMSNKFSVAKGGGRQQTYLYQKPKPWLTPGN